MECDCGYTTSNRANFTRHQKTCRVVSIETKDRLVAEKDEVIARVTAEKDEVIAEKNEMIKYLQEQLAQLAKSLNTPRTVTTNLTQNNANTTTNNNNNQRYTVNQATNVFGNENTDHITSEQWKMLISEPETAIAKLVQLTHSVPHNQNIRVPNKRERRYETIVEEEGAKRWKSVDKKNVLEDLWEEKEMLLQAEVDEDEPNGARFVKFTDKVKDSIDGVDNGKMYKEQLDQIHNTLTDAFR